MNRRFAILALVAGTLAGGPWAQAEIVKCVDKAGRVTLTDLPCNSGSAVPVPPAQSAAPAPDQSSPDAASAAQPTVTADYGYREPPPPPDPLRMGAVRIHLSPAEFGPSGSAKARYARLARPAASQTFVVDTATLRAARTTLATPAVVGDHQLAAR